MKLSNWIKRTAVLMAILLIFSGIPVTVFAVSDTTVYSVESAVAWANENWDNEEGGVCDQFVKACLAAGNIDILAGGVTPVMQALIDGQFGTFVGTVKIDDSGIYAKASDNPGISIGDPLFVYCKGCQDYTHTVLVTGIDENGNLTIHGRNPAQENYAYLGTFRHTEEHTDCYIDAVHITEEPFHDHDFSISYYDGDHPHKASISCVDCGVHYYLGWNMTVKSCTSCNPPLGNRPIFKSFEETSTAWTMEWSTVEGATGYQVWRSKALDTTYWFPIMSQDSDGNSVPKMQVTLSNSKSSMTEGTTYFYKVEAVLKDGTSVYSDIKDTAGNTYPVESEDEDIIETPVATVALNASDKPVISWNKVDGAAKYELQYSTTGESSSFTKLINTTSNKITHSSSKAGTTYYYRVRAIDSSSTASEYSNVVSITVPKVETISAPTMSVTLNTSDKPVISWNKVDGAAKYELQYSTTGESSSFTKLINTTSTKITHSSSKAGTTYYYRVRVVASNGSVSDYSNVVSIAIPKAETAKTPVMTGVLKNNKPYLTWTAVDNAVRYDVYRSTSGKVGTFTRLIKTTSKALTNSSVKEGTTYYYKVRAVYSNGTVSEFSNLVELTPQKAETSSTVPVITGTLKNGKPYLTWTAVDNAVRYDVYRSTSGKVGTFSRLIKSTGYSLTNSSAKPGTVYYYKVRAVYANGTVSEFSNLVSSEATK